jgi:hypothetical protein
MSKTRPAKTTLPLHSLTLALTPRQDAFWSAWRPGPAYCSTITNETLPSLTVDFPSVGDKAKFIIYWLLSLCTFFSRPKFNHIAF